MYSQLFSFSLFVIIFSSDPKSEPCPFNEECTCTNLAPKAPLVFDYAYCTIKGGKLPQFDPAPEGKYHVNLNFEINNANLRVIPAKHFAAFEYIGYLYLNHKSASPLELAAINWDDAAFDGVQLHGIFTDGLDGLIPAPVALKNSSSTYFYIYNGHTSISIKDDSFKNFPSLGYFRVYNTTIQEMQPNAFLGLENKLQQVSLQYSDIHDFVVKEAIKNLNNLDILDLSYNYITEVKSDSFPEINLNYLYLTGNPIEKLDKKSFTTLKGLRYVSFEIIETLKTVDLATFTGLNTEFFVALFHSDKSLKSVVIPDTGEFTKTFRLDIGNTGLKTIDPKIADLMNKNPGMYLFFNQNTHLKCKGLEWMSKIECPACMLIDSSKCADQQGQKLVDYLKSIDPESKCKEFRTWPRHLQMRGNCSHQRQHGINKYRLQIPYN